MMYGSWDIEHDRQNFLSFRTILCSFTSLRTRKIKILKKWKSSWRYYHFKHKYHKWKSYDVWFLRYGARYTECFLILDHFCPFTPPFLPSPHPRPNSPENQNFEKMKKHVEISSFYTSLTKIMILCNVVPEIWHATHVIVIFHFGLFFALLPPPLSYSPKNQNFKKKKKWKKRLEISPF